MFFDMVPSLIPSFPSWILLFLKNLLNSTTWQTFFLAVWYEPAFFPLHSIVMMAIIIFLSSLHINPFQNLFLHGHRVTANYVEIDYSWNAYTIFNWWALEAFSSKATFFTFPFLTRLFPVSFCLYIIPTFSKHNFQRGNLICFKFTSNMCVHEYMWQNSLLYQECLVECEKENCKGLVKA